MATRLKTIEFAIPVLATMANNSSTAMTQVTLYIPEFSGTVTFKSCIIYVCANPNTTSTTGGNVTAREISYSVGGAGASTDTNSNLYTGSGEDTHVFHGADMTAHFVSNWTSGASQTLDVSILLNGSHASLTWNNVCAWGFITYEYDDTQTTQIKTVRIPLDMPISGLDTSKPGSPLASIPNLSTHLPEASKTFRDAFITVQGNTQAASTSATDLRLQLDSTTSVTTNAFEKGSNSDYFHSYVWNCGPQGSNVLNTSSNMGFYAWSSLGDFNHSQAWLTVTYEFDASASNDCFVSLKLPMEVNSPMGSGASDYQSGDRELWIEEPDTITGTELAFMSFWDSRASITGIQNRISVNGTDGAWSGALSDAASVICGSNAAMLRDDTNVGDLVRGRNTLRWSVYRTDTTDLGHNVCGFWIVNYTCGKPSQGYGAANHTVMWNLGTTFDGAADDYRVLSAIAPSIPDTDRFYSAVGVNFKYFTNTTGTAAGISVQVERLSAEGGPSWESAYTDISVTDPESGLHETWGQVRSLFQRWPGDEAGDRMSLQTSRRWRRSMANNATGWGSLDLIFTYHSITFEVAGDISGSGGGTVNLELHRASDGELLLETNRSGDGAYSFDWYDDTEDVYVTAYEDSTHVGRSDVGTAA